MGNGGVAASPQHRPCHAGDRERAHGQQQDQGGPPPVPAGRAGRASVVFHWCLSCLFAPVLLRDRCWQENTATRTPLRPAGWAKSGPTYGVCVPNSMNVSGRSATQETQGESRVYVLSERPS